MGVRRPASVSRMDELGRARPGEHFRIDTSYGIVVGQEKGSTRVQLKRGSVWRISMWSPKIRVEILGKAPVDPDTVPGGF